MDWRDNLFRLQQNLAALGPRRLLALGLAGALTVLAVVVAGYMLSRPAFEVLYTGLTPRDVTAIGAALGEARIRYDVSEDGKAVKVAYGEAARARMLLAEKGLPRSSRAGYELFDNIGALGLTSFMQKVTLIRALEGELARTIQNFAGVKAARVHIVLPRRNSFRQGLERPSASVLVRTDAAFQKETADAIRYLVAGAVPGLAIGRVNVMDTAGSLLASGDDREVAAPRRLVELERNVSHFIRQNVQGTLMPYLGTGNFQVSVSVRLNTDKRDTSETIFDPASRVERSVRDIKEKTLASTSSSAGSVSLDQEIPETEKGGSAANSNKEQRERKERLTNYEINTRRVRTISDGYDIARLSIAVVVNRQALETVLGRKLSDADLEQQQEQIAALVRTAAGMSAKRGDQVKVLAVDFIQSKQPLPPVEGPGLAEYAMKIAPVMIQSLAVLVAVFMLVWLGVRPALRLLNVAPEQGAADMAEAQASIVDEAAVQEGAMLPGQEARIPLPQGQGTGEGADGMEQVPEPDLAQLGDDAQRPLNKLRKIIDYDEKQAANVIREWLREGA